MHYLKRASLAPSPAQTKEKSFLTEITEDKLYLESLMAKLHSHKHVSSKCLKQAEKEVKVGREGRYGITIHNYLDFNFSHGSSFTFSAYSVRTLCMSDCVTINISMSADH